MGVTAAGSPGAGVPGRDHHANGIIPRCDHLAHIRAA